MQKAIKKNKQSNRKLRFLKKGPQPGFEPGSPSPVEGIIRGWTTEAFLTAHF